MKKILVLVTVLITILTTTPIFASESTDDFDTYLDKNEIVMYVADQFQEIKNSLFDFVNTDEIDNIYDPYSDYRPLREAGIYMDYTVFKEIPKNKIDTYTEWLEPYSSYITMDTTVAGETTFAISINAIYDSIAKVYKYDEYTNQYNEFDITQEEIENACLYKAMCIVNKYTNNSMSEIEKAKALYDYIALASSIEYDYYAIDGKGEQPNYNYIKYTPIIPNFYSYSYSYVGAAFNNQAVCDGIAQWYILLCRLAGLDATKLKADNHTWVLINFSDGTSMEVDPTGVVSLGFQSDSPQDKAEWLNNNPFYLSEYNEYFGRTYGHEYDTEYTPDYTKITTKFEQ